MTEAKVSPPPKIETLKELADRISITAIVSPSARPSPSMAAAVAPERP